MKTYEFFFDITQIKKREGITLMLKPDGKELLAWEENGKTEELEHSLVLDINISLFNDDIVKKYYATSSSVVIEFDYIPEKAKASVLIAEHCLDIVNNLIHILGLKNINAHLVEYKESDSLIESQKGGKDV